MALAPWVSGIALPLWPAVSGFTYQTSGVGLVPLSLPSAASGDAIYLTTLSGSGITTLSGLDIVTDPLVPTQYGFGAAAIDGASGVYFAQYTGNLLHLASGGSSWLSMPVGRVCTGMAYNTTRANAYLAFDDGSLGVAIGAFAGTVSPSFSSGARGLATSGTTLFSVLPAASGLGTLNLTGTTSGTSGSLATPMSFPMVLAASSPASSVAVGGWDNAALVSGYTDLSFSPAASTNMIAVRPSTNAITLYTGVNENWTVAQTITGTGAPTRAAWATNGVTILVTDPTSGRVEVVSYSGGTIASGQVLAVSGAGQIGILSSSTAALVCHAAGNRVVPLFSTSGVWASGTAVTLAQATSLAITAAASAAVGFASGVAYLSLSGVTWSVAASAALGFLPQALAIDASGTVFAAGNSGSSGMLSIVSGTSVLQTLSWAGSGNSVICRQDQIIVGDPANSLMRVFGRTASASAYTQAATAIAAGALVQIAIGSQTLFAAGSGTTIEYQFTAPYRLERLRTGKVSVYTGGVWSTATLGPNQWPEAVTFDASGNALVATLQNTLYTISSGGTIASSGAIVQNSPQPQTTPIGISSLLLSGSSLYASSSLDGALVKVQ